MDREALGSPPKLVGVTSGVDLSEFSYQRVGRDPDTVIFSGNMGYFPNVQVALWLGRSILPAVARAIPGSRCTSWVLVPTGGFSSRVAPRSIGGRGRVGRG